MIGYKAKKSRLKPNYFFHLTKKSFGIISLIELWLYIKKAGLKKNPALITIMKKYYYFPKNELNIQ
jgi:hypothetical protein